MLWIRQRRALVPSTPTVKLDASIPQFRRCLPRLLNSASHGQLPCARLSRTFEMSALFGKRSRKKSAASVPAIASIAA